MTIMIWYVISLSLPTFALLSINVYWFLHRDKLETSSAAKCYLNLSVFLTEAR